MGIAIFFWFFFVIIWNFVTAGAYFTFGSDAYFVIDLLNPISSFSLLTNISINLENFDLFTMGTNTPSFYTSEVLYPILLLWIVLPLIFTFYIFKKKDI